MHASAAERADQADAEAAEWPIDHNSSIRALLALTEAVSRPVTGYRASCSSGGRVRLPAGKLTAGTGTTCWSPAAAGGLADVAAGVELLLRPLKGIHCESHVLIPVLLTSGTDASTTCVVRLVLSVLHVRLSDAGAAPAVLLVPIAADPGCPEHDEARLAALSGAVLPLPIESPR